MHVAGRAIEVPAVAVLDGAAVRDSEAENQPTSAGRLNGLGLTGHSDRMTSVGNSDRRPQLNVGRSLPVR